MGVLSVQCEGRDPKSAGRCGRRFWRFLERPASCPDCGTETAAATCVNCGATLVRGARHCGSCARARPTELTEELLALGPGMFAMHRRVLASPNSTVVFTVGPGVLVRALVEASESGSQSGQQFSIRSGLGPSDATVSAAALGRELCKRYGRDPVGVDLIVIGRGPLVVAIEVSGVRGSDQLAMDVSIAITADVSDLGSFIRLLSGRPSISSEEVEARLAEIAGPAVYAVLGQWKAVDLARADARRRLWQQLGADLAADLAQLGLRISGVSRLFVRSEVLERAAEGRSKIAEFELETDARYAASAAIGRREELELEGRAGELDRIGRREELELEGRTRELDRSERSEGIDARRQRLVQAIRSRISDDRIHEYRDSERFQQLVRETEHQLGLAGLIHQHELDGLRDKLARGLRMEQVLSDIELRKLTRGVEVDEAGHGAVIEKIRAGGDIAVADMRAEAERRRREDDAAADRRIREQDGKLHTSQLKDKIEIDKDLDRHDADLRERERAADHRREAERREQEARHRKEEQELKSRLTPEQLMVLQTTDAEVYKRILDARQPHDDRVKMLEDQIAKLHQSARSEQQAAYSEALQLAREAMQRMSETAAAAGRQNINNFGPRPGGRRGGND